MASMVDSTKAQLILERGRCQSICPSGQRADNEPRTTRLIEIKFAVAADANQKVSLRLRWLSVAPGWSRCHATV